MDKSISSKNRLKAPSLRKAKSSSSHISLSSRLEAKHSRPSSDFDSDDDDRQHSSRRDRSSPHLDDSTPHLATDVPLTRHTDLWFPDGSVICQAETTLFRVHISQLARHSLCFRDMFSLPQPKSTSASNTLHHDDSENCPVVHLHDTAEDVGNLLTALYDGP